MKIEEARNKILKGDALKQLKKLPDKSINMCVTSPPYWALRDYGDGTETIWDEDEDCEHEFEKVVTKQPNMSGGKGHTQDGNKGSFAVDYNDRTKESCFCQKCGAWKGQLGLEPNFDLYIKHLCDIFEEVKRVIKDDGTCWVNIGDTYSSGGGNKGIPNKCLTMIPFRFAIEMVNRGWILRNTIIWHKPSCMPSSAKDRFTVDFEYLFFFSKKKKYYFEQQLEPLAESSLNDRILGKGRFEYNGKRDVNDDFIQNVMCGFNKKGRNKRTTWDINPASYPDAHFAVYPEELIETPIKAGCPKKGIVLDPFFGAGTTGVVACKQGKNFVGIELNDDYIEQAEERIKPHLEQEMLDSFTK